MARTARIGPETYARVMELVKSGKSRTEAFAEVAEERKSSPGTVAANFYRVARQKGQGRNTLRGGRGSATRAEGDLRQIVRQITELMETLVDQVEERDRKLREVLGLDA